jgi:hypothetical protein
MTSYNMKPPGADALSTISHQPRTTKTAGDLLIRDAGAEFGTAIDVITNVIAVTGCTMAFDPVQVRSSNRETENLFGRLTRAALQLRPSTYGSGPGGPRRDRPE